MDLTTKVFSILPKVQETPFIKEFFQIIGCYSETFLKNRTQNYILKISKAKWEIKKKLENSLKTERNVYFRLFAVKFSTQKRYKKALGILVALNFLSDSEQFKQSHLLNVLRSLLPGISLSDESFSMFIEERNKHLFCYCEIEKLKGKNLSFQEGLELKKSLAREIKGNIQASLPELWVPENQEQTIKDAIHLHKEVTSVNDPTHVSILFKDQQIDSIRFSIIIVRVSKKNKLSLKKEISNLNHDIEIKLEKTEPFLEECKKETLAFSWKISSALFYRKNHAIDLLKARQYICTTLEQAIGIFRDYNGALLSKQAEQFNSLVATFSTQVNDLSDFEDLFYSLYPANIQLLISMETILEISKNFYDLKKEKSKKPFSIRLKKHNKIFFVIIKTSSDSYDSIFSDLIKDPLVARTSKRIGSYKYHFLVQTNPFDFSIIQSIQEKILTLKRGKKNVFPKEFKINFQEDPPISFHPHLHGDIKTFTVCKALYDGLMRINPKGHIEPSIAKSVEISTCKKIYIFRLRDCKWSNGIKTTSYDFSRAWKQAIFSRKNGRNPTGSRNLFLIKNSEQVANKILPLDKLGIYTPDCSTLKVEINQPHPFFLHLLATTIFSPLLGNELEKEPTVFNGPFVPIAYTNDTIELRKNKYYWDEKSVNLEKITIFFNKDPDETYSSFKKKDLDLIVSPFSSLPKKKIKEPTQKYETSYPFWFFCNTKHPKLKPLEIRKALSLSIDREKLTKDFLYHEPLYSIVPSEFSLISNIKDYYPSSLVKKARLLFEEGLKKSGYGKRDFKLTLNHSDIPYHRKISLFAKDCWQKVLGIEVKLVETPWNAYLKNLFIKDFEIGGLNIINDYESILYFLNIFSNYSNHFSNWESDEYKSILSKEIISKDLLKQAEEILMNELPVIPVTNQTEDFFIGNAKNFVFPKFGYADFKWIKK